MKPLATTITVLGCIAAFASQSTGSASTDHPLFDMEELRDASTLKIDVLQDWHLVKGPIPTRQKSITINVGEIWPGQDLRIPVRFVVPANRKAKGFHLTGGHQLKQFESEAAVRGVDSELINGGVGLVHTIVQEPKTYGEGELGDAMRKRFIDTLNTRYSIQYWGWPATLMRATTAAYAETDHFEIGKIALSGGSKNGASPSVALIADQRLTALHASVSPPWESPLRLCDPSAWEALDAFNEQDGQTKPHTFLGGAFGPIYNADALKAGHSWAEIQGFAKRMAHRIFISKNLDALAARNVDLLFHPGTHDMVAYDLAWGGAHYPQMPVYLGINSGHGKKHKPDSSEKDEQNKAAFLLNHFFDAGEPLLESPSVSYRKNGDALRVTVTFKPGSKPESGRIWWIYDRGPDGSVAYIRDLFPEDQWKDMKQKTHQNVWSTDIELKPGVNRIDFFSNHRKTIQYQLKAYSTYISSPYTRVELR